MFDPTQLELGFEEAMEGDIGIMIDSEDERDTGLKMRPLSSVQAGPTTQPMPVPTPNTKRTKKRQNTISASKFEDLYSLCGEELGRGAYAHVQACVSTVTGDEYAVKIIEKTPQHSRMRVIKEIETFHMCASHPNIVHLVEYFEEDNCFYLVFEKMQGGPLFNHIQKRGVFTEQEASHVVADIANALKMLHDRGIAHRDVKPENVLCTFVDAVSPVKLCDLDLASKMNLFLPSTITTPELVSPVGSAEFMAPEVVDAFVGDALTYDKRCDIWSVGVILYIMLCGYPPFFGDCWRNDCGWDKGLSCADCQEALFSRIQKGEFDFPSEDWSHISRNAKDLIQHLLVKDVRMRYSADDVLRHPFVAEDQLNTPLQTPDVLTKNDSVRDLKVLSETFNAPNRFAMLQQTDGGQMAAHVTKAANRRPLSKHLIAANGGRVSCGKQVTSRQPSAQRTSDERLSLQV